MVTEGWAGYSLQPDLFVDTEDFMGFVYANHDPWIWCESVPCWFNIPEQTASAGSGWVYVPNLDPLDIDLILGTNWGYSFALGKWLYLTDSGWVYVV
jgi:hypothetical protein